MLCRRNNKPGPTPSVLARCSAPFRAPSLASHGSGHIPPTWTRPVPARSGAPASTLYSSSPAGNRAHMHVSVAWGWCASYTGSHLPACRPSRVRSPSIASNDVDPGAGLCGKPALARSAAVNVVVPPGPLAFPLGVAAPLALAVDCGAAPSGGGVSAGVCLDCFIAASLASSAAIFLLVDLRRRKHDRPYQHTPQTESDLSKRVVRLTRCRRRGP